VGEALERSGGPSRAERMRARATKASAGYLELAQRRPVLGLPMVFVSLYLARQGLLLASAVAFRMFLWLMPLALIAAGIFAGVSTAYPDAPVLAADAVGVTGTAREQVARALAEGYESWWIAVVVGLGAFLWTSRTLLRNLVMVSAHLWQVPRARQKQSHVLLSTVIFAGVWLPLLMIGAVFVARVDALFPGAWFLAMGLEAVLCGAAWLVICRRLPDRRDGWQDLLPGAALFGIAIALIHLVSRIYLPARIEHSSALYGSLGVAGAILVWLLVFGQLVVASILVNVVSLDHREQSRSLALAAARQGPDHDQ
jgi:uncharacterized BrkB/YihY/UPF0761 family membrane protein